MDRGSRVIGQEGLETAAWAILALRFSQHFANEARKKDWQIWSQTIAEQRVAVRAVVKKWSKEK